MKIVVTGGAGFIGYHLCRRLISLGHQVQVIDNLDDSYDLSLKQHRLNLLKRAGASAAIKSVGDYSWEDVNFFEPYPEVVVHLAAKTNVRSSMDEPYEYLRNNVLETQVMIDSLEKLKSPPRVVYASTSCALAGNDLPWREGEKVGYQLNHYGLSKRTNENQFAVSGLRSTGVRFFTSYGPLGRPDMALHEFVRRIYADEPIVLFNGGDMARDFTYVDDVIRGLELLIFREPERHEVFNLGRGQKIPLRRFVSAIEFATGLRARIEEGPRHPADTLETLSDCAGLGEMGWRPEVDVEDGVRAFVDWYRHYYDVK